MPQVSNLEIVIGANMDAAVDVFNSVKREIGQIGTVATQAGQAMSGISIAIAAFAGAAIFASTRTTELKQALDNIGGQGDKQFAQLTTEANKLGLGIESIAKAAIKLEAAGVSNETTRRVIDGIGEAVRKMGGDDAMFNTVVQGMTRIAATGTLTSRSLRQIEQTAPEMRQFFETAFGTDNVKKILGMHMTVEQFMKGIADAAEAASPHVRTIRDAFTELKNTAETAMGDLGQRLGADLHLGEILDHISHAIKGVIDWFINLPGPVRGAIEVIAGVIAVAGPLLLIIGSVIAIAPALGAAFTIMTGPVGMVIVAIGLLTAAIIWMAGHWDRVKEIAMSAIAKITGAIEGLLNAIGMGDSGIAKAMRNWTNELTANAAAAGKAADAQDKLAEAARRKAEADRMNKTGGDVELHGTGNGPKGAKEKEERIAEVKVMADSVSAAELRADDENQSKREANSLALLRVAFGKSLQQQHKEAEDEKVAKIDWTRTSQAAVEKMKEETDHRIYQGSTNRFRHWTNDMKAALRNFNDQFNQIIQQGTATAFTALGSGIGKAFESGNFKDLGKGLLSAIGGILQQVGQAAIALGIGLLGIQTALKTLGPYGAIAAGVALIAVATVLSDTLSSAGNSMGTSSAGSSSGGPSPAASSGPDGNIKALQNMVSNSNQSSLVATVKGNDLAFVLAKSGNRSSN